MHSYQSSALTISYWVSILVGCWRGVRGQDLNSTESVIHGEYKDMTLSGCNQACKSAWDCKSFHFHPRQDDKFSNCNLKTNEFTSQSNITNNGSDWTLYWYETTCTSGIFKYFVWIYNVL